VTPRYELAAPAERDLEDIFFMATLGWAREPTGARTGPFAVGRVWGERIAAMLDASLRDRPLIPAAQALDLPFSAFMSDEIGAALRVCEFADLPTDASVRRRFEEYQAANPRGRHGTIEYRFEDFGPDAAALRARLSAYVERFSVLVECVRRS